MKIKTILLCTLLTSTLSFNSYAEAPKAPISPINLNTADVQALSHSIKGIGLKRAEKIVKYRTEHGRFKSVNDLAKVPGFGERFVKNKQDTLLKTFTLQ